MPLQVVLPDSELVMPEASPVLAGGHFEASQINPLAQHTSLLGPVKNYPSVPRASRDTAQSKSDACTTCCLLLETPTDGATIAAIGE